LNAGRDLCHFCGGDCRGLTLMGNPDASFRVVVPASGSLEAFRVSREGVLLQKILEAMSLDSLRIGYVFLENNESKESESGLSDEDGCRMERMKASGTRFLLAFGPEAFHAVSGPGDRTEPADAPLRGKVFDRAGIAFLGTESLHSLVENPALKKAAWEELKLVMRELVKRELVKREYVARTGD
jgi:hypothetical protein